MTERVFEIDGFRGMDTSNSPYDVKKNRAVELNNLISVDGVNRKRNGYLERARLSGRINGIWRYDENGTEVFIVHAGTRIYRVTLGDNSLLSSATVIFSAAEDIKSWGLIDANILYILAGDYLAYGYVEKTKKYELVSIFGSDYAYIPTTTVSIDPEGAADKTRSDFEPANLLTPKRRNTLQLAGAGAEKTEANRTFYLDSEISADYEVVIEFEHILDGVKKKTSLKTKKIGTKYGAELFLADGETLTETVKGAIDYALGKIVFTDAYAPLREGEDSAIVTFCPSYTDGAERVTKCTFGTQFGLSGNNDRLFISGNAAYPNLDFYSESYNYMYFPVDNYTVLGGEQSAITGYSRINDGSLGIHKGEGDSSGIYYRTATAETFTDAATGAQLTETIFPIKAGAVGEYCVDWRSCKRLGSDPLFASTNGIYALTIGGSVTSNERYAKERSENINNELTAGVGMANAIAEVIDNRYMLFTGDKCYIADARYKYSEQKLADDTYNFEWWRWTLPGTVTAVAKLGVALLIGTDDGRIFSPSSGFKDTIYTPLGAVTFNGNAVYMSDAAKTQLLGSKPTAHVAYYGTDAGGKTQAVSCYIRSSGTSVRLFDDKSYTAPHTPKLLNGCKIAEVIETPVKSVFRSPLIDLGSSLALKTISSLYAVIDPITNTECNIRLESAARSADVGFSLKGTFDFGDVDFGDFSFGEELFTRTSIRRVNIRNANYIQFTVTSDTERDAAVNKLGITYTAILNGRGGRI